MERKERDETAQKVMTSVDQFLRFTNNDMAKETIYHAIRAAEIEALEWAKRLFEDSLQIPTPERRWEYFRSRMDAEIKRRKTV